MLDLIRSEESGQALVEYTLILVLIVIASLAIFRTNVAGSIVTKVHNAVNDIMSSF